jgi:hypothetical protein
VLILNCIPEARGWSPIQHMIVLAAELCEAEVLTIHDRHPGLTELVSGSSQAEESDSFGAQRCVAIDQQCNAVRFHAGDPAEPVWLIPVR